MRSRRVEAGHRLVREDEPRLLHQRSSDADPLLLPSAQLIGTRERLLRDPDAPQVLHRLELHASRKVVDQRPLRSEVPEATREGIGEHRGALHQVELLEDHPDLPPEAAQLLVIQRRDLDVVDVHLA